MSLLLRALGAEVAVHLHAETTGVFPRPPEPIPEMLGELGAAIRHRQCAVGFAVDPDVDRCVVLDETGACVGEELTVSLCL
jgi:phosphomannomutase